MCGSFGVLIEERKKNGGKKKLEKKKKKKAWRNWIQPSLLPK